ncbi:hypothetical protein AAFF_G00180730 [Aldrovandia affinis]|uniref:Uncharacterized protein n=1 Tax=Aldrovandia affinis TaxID=143900 RepID=A0AAD7SYH6_9TELE|nr:hypothetical protein AAFF_G00180730 [Aldrovandia affinis]
MRKDSGKQGNQFAVAARTGALSEARGPRLDPVSLMEGDRQQCNEREKLANRRGTGTMVSRQDDARFASAHSTHSKREASSQRRTMSIRRRQSKAEAEDRWQGPCAADLRLSRPSEKGEIRKYDGGIDSGGGTASAAGAGGGSRDEDESAPEPRRGGSESPAHGAKALAFSASYYHQREFHQGRPKM